MTVGELIAELSRFPDDAELIFSTRTMVSGYPEWDAAGVGVETGWSDEANDDAPTGRVEIELGDPLDDFEADEDEAP